MRTCIGRGLTRRPAHASRRVRCRRIGIRRASAAAGHRCCAPCRLSAMSPSSPFERLASLGSGIPVSLDPEAVAEKLVHSQAWRLVLRAEPAAGRRAARAGLRASGISRRASCGDASRRHRGATHASGPAGALRWSRLAGRRRLRRAVIDGRDRQWTSELEQKTPHERAFDCRRLGRGTSAANVAVRGTWRPMYRFDLTRRSCRSTLKPQLPACRTIPNHDSSAGLIAALPTPGGTSCAARYRADLV